ncbi:putative dehydrogenases MviM [Agrobacterium tumefaciens str. Kerr 14]|uniref:Putative dehydrogenases MviM n=1 Tax=Agrobacterium tumefaciens str. Kerr 14 TaxID=1183424 RepID=A0A1S7SAH0_AGRTU|nr:Gfo/Idh/MocA family oxidoreductase [Agrobacterium tumefaciens]CUX65327.1 putative dehydrogenases MviM [Agrobacterium tumefaciens str. Kerr 14]
MRARVLVVGAGRIAAVHALSISRHPRLTLAGFVDPKGGHTLATDFDAALFSNWQEGIDRGKPDAVVITSPTASHVDYLLKCAALGMPCLCEKPISLEREPMLRAIEAVTRSQIPVILGFHRRYDPHRREMYFRRAEGEIGALEHMLFLSRDPRLPDREVMKHQGGMVADMVIHDLDEALWYTGRLPDRICASLSRKEDPSLKEIGDFDTANIQMEWMDGPVAQISAARRAAHAFEQRLELCGPLGKLVCEDPRISVVSVDSDKGTTSSRRFSHFSDRYRDAYAAEMDNLAGILTANAEPVCSLNDGLMAFELSQRVSAVARTMTAD